MGYPNPHKPDAEITIQRLRSLVVAIEFGPFLRDEMISLGLSPYLVLRGIKDQISSISGEPEC